MSVQIGPFELIDISSTRKEGFMNESKKTYMLPLIRAFANYLRRKYIISSTKIALIGEKSKSKAKGTLCRTISDQNLVPLKNITIFTEEDKFRKEDGQRFDLLLGCRPCEAEETIFESATKYKKQFMIMPCTCGNLARKAVRYIRKYPIITEVDSSTEQDENKAYKHNSWLILS